MNQATADVRDTLADWAPNHALDAYAHALNEAAEFARVNDAILFFAKPWNWHREYAAWVDAGKPVGPGDHGWDVFLEALGAL